MAKKEKCRADELLVKLNFFETRSKAQAFIMAGEVEYLKDEKWQPVQKAGQAFALSGASFRVNSKSHQDVGRGAQKIRGAFERWTSLASFVKAGLCLDIGSSTGGFTQVLLEKGASQVIALDVGTNQLHERLRNHAQVTSLEKTHILTVNEEFWSEQKIALPFDFMVSDLSFISMKKIILHVWPWLKSSGNWILLVKPQFELHARHIKKGIVKSEEDRLNALNGVLSLFKNFSDCDTIEFIECPLKGSQGNQEYLVWVRKK